MANTRRRRRRRKGDDLPSIVQIPRQGKPGPGFWAWTRQRENLGHWAHIHGLEAQSLTIHPYCHFTDIMPPVQVILLSDAYTVARAHVKLHRKVSIHPNRSNHYLTLYTRDSSIWTVKIHSNNFQLPQMIQPTIILTVIITIINS